GMDFNTANQTLTNLGLAVAQTQKQSDLPAGQVIAQSLPPGSGAVNGASIILTVSAGPPQVQVPNVSGVGYSFDQAAQILQQAGLQAVKVSDFPGGHVGQQNPGPGTTVPQGTQVQLWVLP
ncbi:MAG TPA: PASTA domain-containing protein, partial [Micromonosporaceae bacterium]|nr:PASTA domain-containing protein [Micromonosporaceae bacterium]